MPLASRPCWQRKMLVILLFFLCLVIKFKVSNENLVSQFLYLIAGSDILNITFNLLDSAYKCQRGFSFHTYS